jgi:hypothetical protein
MATTRPALTAFIFDVAEDIPDRQHAFFVYAVDDKGKADPTPARFIFNALDRFPPLPVFEEASGTGTTYFFDAGGVLRSEVRSFAIRDTNAFGPPPSDTIPSGSRITFRFHGQVTVVGGQVKGFRYKLDEPQLQPTNPDSLFHGNKIEYHVPGPEADPQRLGIDTLAVATGTKVFTLRAVDQANGSYDRFRRFQMNFSPDTWFSGPDPDATGAPWQTNSMGEKFALLNVAAFPLNQGLPPAGAGSLMGPRFGMVMPVNSGPSTRTSLSRSTGHRVPAARVRHRPHGVLVIIHNGGFDTDSLPGQRGRDPHPPGPVLKVVDAEWFAGWIPFVITNYLSPSGPLSVVAQSPLPVRPE